MADNEPGVSRFTHQSLPELEQLLRESREAARDFRDLSRSLKQSPSQLLYEPNYRGVEVSAIVDAYARATDSVLAKVVADVGATLSKTLEAR